MKKEFNKHGKKITGKEYDQKVTDLYADTPPSPSKKISMALMRKELNLSIDHRLGLDFPDDRREKLWETKKAFDKKVTGYAIAHIFKRAITGKHDYLPNKLENAYSKVLDNDELNEFLGPESERALPPKP